MDSVWSQDGQMPHFLPLQGEHRTDVLIIGGGITGLLCAWQLRRAGVDCTVAEADVLTDGVTKNSTAKLTFQHGACYHGLIDRFGPERARMYLQANQLALEEYRNLCRQIPCDLERRDNIIYSRTDLSILEREVRALEILGCPAELARDLPLPLPTVGGVKVSDQAQFHPLKFLSAVSRDLTVFQRTQVRRLEKGTAVTDRGKIRAEAFIVATHFPFLNRHGSYFLKLYQQRSYVLALEHAPVPEAMYLDQAENGLSFRSCGDKLLLGGGGHRTGHAGGGWQELEDFAQSRYPGAAVTHRWATQDCMSLDGVPYIGQYSARTPGVYVATGFNKWGMTSAMAAAMILRDLITGKGSDFAPVFSPSRGMLRPQLMTNALEAGKNLLSLSPKRCPHMGCALKWNPQEHSWDCPCHGSRFTAEGKRIDNPACRDLKK